MDQPFEPSFFPYAYPEQDTQTFTPQENTKNSINDLYDRQSKPHPVFCFSYGGKFASIFPHEEKSQTQSSGSPMSLNLHSMYGQNDNSRKFNKMEKVSIGRMSEMFEDDLFRILKTYPGPLLGQFSGTFEKKRPELFKFMNERILFLSQDGEKQNNDLRLLWEVMRVLVNVSDKLVQTNEESSEDEDEGTEEISEAEKAVNYIRNLLKQHHIESELHGEEDEYSLNNFKTDITPVTVTQQNLKNLENLIVSNNVKRACEFAMQKRLWPHALLLASSISMEMYQSVVTAFTQSVFNGHSPLKSLYLTMINSGKSLFINTNETEQILRYWKQNVMSLLPNRNQNTLDVFLKIAQLLWDNGKVLNSHVVLLLAEVFLDNPEKINIISSVSGQPMVKLIGGDHIYGNNFMYLDSIILTEIFHWCKLLSFSKARGLKKPPLIVDPRFDTYRLEFVKWLIDAGEDKKAGMYLKTIEKNLGESQAQQMNSKFVIEFNKVKQRYEGATEGGGKFSLGGRGFLAKGLESIVKIMSSGSVSEEKDKKEKKQTLPPKSLSTEFGAPVVDMQKSTVNKQNESLDYGSGSYVHNDEFSDDYIKEKSKKNPKKDEKKEEGFFSKLIHFLSPGPKNGGGINFGEDNERFFSEEYDMWIPNGEDPAEYARKQRELAAPPKFDMGKKEDENDTPLFSNFEDDGSLSKNMYVSAFGGMDTKEESKDNTDNIFGNPFQSSPKKDDLPPSDSPFGFQTFVPEEVGSPSKFVPASFGVEEKEDDGENENKFAPPSLGVEKKDKKENKFAPPSFGEEKKENRFNPPSFGIEENGENEKKFAPPSFGEENVSKFAPAEFGKENVNKFVPKEDKKKSEIDNNKFEPIEEKEDKNIPIYNPHPFGEIEPEEKEEKNILNYNPHPFDEIEPKEEKEDKKTPINPHPFGEIETEEKEEKNAPMYNPDPFGINEL